MQGEKLAALLAGVVLAATVFWAVFTGGSKSRDADGRKNLDDNSFEVTEVPVEETGKLREWGQPAPQGGPNWIFDIFTPPVIYYDEATGTFTVTPPFPDADPVEESFELEFAGVSRIPFRFQLVSYAGARGNYVLTMENLDSGKDIFCSPGETVAGQEIRILGFNEMREVAASSVVGATEAFDLVGEAIVEDLRTGKHYTLHHDKTTFLENPMAQFVSPSGDNIYLAAGDSWDSDQGSYRVVSVDHESQSAVVEKTSSDVGDKITKMFQSPNSFNSSDLSNRKSRKSDPSPGTF